MTGPLPPAISFEPDLSVSSASPAPIARELAAFDRRVGWLQINRWTLKPLRRLLPALAPRPALSGLRLSEHGEVGPGLLVISPERRKSRGALVLIHGGGLVIGSNREAAAIGARFAHALGIVVICPGYRLAPEAPFPAAQEDLLAAWNWTRENAEPLGIDPSRVVIGGTSAGGGLAAALTQRLLAQGGPLPAAQLLVYPMLDDRTTARRELDRSRHRVWNNRSNRFGWTSYLGHAPGAAAPRPFAVPARHMDLTSLPPAWIGIGTCDLFLDENRDYARRLKKAGVDVTYVEAAGAIHGFDKSETALGKAFLACQLDFLRDHAC